MGSVIRIERIEGVRRNLIGAVEADISVGCARYEVSLEGVLGLIN